jgi:hypothetical protein
MITVTYPSVHWYRYRKQTGITAFRTVVEFDGMTTKSVSFESMPNAVIWIEDHADNLKKLSIPQSTTVPLGTESRHMTFMGVPKSDFKISLN